MLEDKETEFENPGKSVTVQCVQYLIIKHLKSKNFIKKEELIKTILKGRISLKNYERAIEDVAATLRNVFGLSISYIKDDYKQFIITNDIENVICINQNNPYSMKYRILLKPIVTCLVMQHAPISEGQMWNIVERFAVALNLDINYIKKMIKGDFVKDQYLQYNATDETTITLDPEKMSNWFSLGTRSLLEFNQNILLQHVGEILNLPPQSFKRVYAAINK
ncbi:uncharacterized protein LOC126908100 [Daktulosphaira vitifoliae]|uniref:uncharacterized protein LOC126908100 n=1 Tax=Daktulosphaira vitifoliae TaxID=58002 RepID=UPI0021AA3561|nr:uncharacterized protein LOC126908100 [Daktulosphaira vitifoliae]